MQAKLLLPILLAGAIAGADTDTNSSKDERVLGVYIFHRHGDRTAKAWKPVNLTALGADQAHSSGAYYRSRYVRPDPARGPGPVVVGAHAGAARPISPDTAVPAQLAVTAPRDPVLYSSALAFLQGLYPPLAAAAAADERLANGSRVAAPLGGYQYVPVDPVGDGDSADRPEDNAWLQGGSGCVNAEVSSNGYFASAEYRATYDGSLDFYRRLLPVVNATYDEDAVSFKNAYSIFDLINVATIHNASIPSSSLLTPAALARLYSLASAHEWNLAYNASEPVRAMAGAVLAGQVVDALQAIVDAKPKAPRLHAQFGAYGTFMAFFGLARLPAASPDFYGICNYASSMAFELVTDAPIGAKVRDDDVAVRFLFANGTAAEHGLEAYPLFGQDRLTLPWHDFKAAMSKFAIVDSEHWCGLCGKTDGKCASTATAALDGNAFSRASSDKGVSRPVAGVIGALVTLVVILAVQAAVMLFGGLRLVKKSTLAGAHQSGVGVEAAGAKSGAALARPG
ncbi:Histidine acid phosphatase [Hirsutella rhossiliensis]|uniref:Histidine acid phosphatase n=1 Tax=Hirsutella rhossiliensis TaxID=111463 RepID=A0A9P8SJS5_9HYPO|nr:Histidine acid phosphatase [Hirsutella rhossiliensis]KAH0963351.1 Histidine acid phosphatase [Hirsutella rhossiliensis]